MRSTPGNVVRGTPLSGAALCGARIIDQARTR